MTNVVGIVICVVLITLFIFGMLLLFDKIVTSFEKIEKAEKERHDIIIKIIENMGNIHSQK